MLSIDNMAEKIGVERGMVVDMLKKYNIKNFSADRDGTLLYSPDAMKLVSAMLSGVEKKVEEETEEYEEVEEEIEKVEEETEEIDEEIEEEIEDEWISLQTTLDMIGIAYSTFYNMHLNKKFQSKKEHKNVYYLRSEIEEYIAQKGNEKKEVKKDVNENEKKRQKNVKAKLKEMVNRFGEHAEIIKKLKNGKIKGDIENIKIVYQYEDIKEIISMIRGLG